MKQITVLGANGRVGSLVVKQLLDRGYIVKAFVRGNISYEHRNLRVYTGDIYDANSVARALEGSDAVISALGSWGTQKKDILEVGMIHTIGAMQRHGIDRIVTLTGAEARAYDDDLSFVHIVAHLAASIFAGKILRDGERHIALLEASGLEWTTVRSPVMNESGSMQFKVGSIRPYPWLTIHRHAVATTMVNMLEDRSHIGQAPYITR